MKNFIKLFVVVVAVAFVFISCQKGGTIEVVNSTSNINLVVIVEGVNVLGVDFDKNGTALQPGAKKTFTFTEDGTYTVVASSPAGFLKTVILLGGNSEKVVIK